MRGDTQLWLRLAVIGGLTLTTIAATPRLGRCDVDLGIADDETFKRPNSWSQLPKKLAPTETLLAGDATGPASRPGSPRRCALRLGRTI